MSTEETTTTTQEQIVEDCSNSDVVTKYKVAAEIANFALEGVMKQCVPGKKIVEVCQFGDAIIEQRCAAVFKSKKIEKGISFPTCISVNEVICHYSPLIAESTELKAGDWVKVDLGCHIDGYIAVTAHTFLVKESEDADVPQITGTEADVFQAVHDAVEVCARLIKPGNKNSQVTKALEQIQESYGIKAVQGTLMHQMKRFVIDGNQMIAQKNDPETKTEEFEFKANEVYAIDVCFTNGNPRPVESELRTTVFKRAVEKQYRLKMKASRYVLSEVNAKYPILPFSIRAFEDERQARMGVVECVKHGLIQAYPVLHTRASEDKVVHVKKTILLLSSGNTVITGVDLPVSAIKSEKKADDEIQAILATAIKPKKKKKKAAKKSTETETTDMD